MSREPSTTGDDEMKILGNTVRGQFIPIKSSEDINELEILKEEILKCKDNYILYNDFHHKFSKQNELDDIEMEINYHNHLYEICNYHILKKNNLKEMNIEKNRINQILKDLRITKQKLIEEKQLEYTNEYIRLGNSLPNDISRILETDRYQFHRREFNLSILEK